MKDEIKEILLKDFNEILVKEFCTDWKEKRLYIELLVNSTPFSNLLDYITNLQNENEKLKKGYYTVKVGLEEIGILNELRDYKTRIDKAIEYTNQFINYKTSRIDTFENVELVLETILQILKGE